MAFGIDFASGDGNVAGCDCEGYVVFVASEASVADVYVYEEFGWVAGAE